MVDFIIGKNTKEIVDFGFDKRELYGVGKEKDQNFWNSVYRQALLNNFLYKDIENYGLLKLTDEGRSFLKTPKPIKISLNHNFDTYVEVESASNKSNVLDEILIKMLKDLRKTISKQKNIPPYVIFQDPSLEDMATLYPISMADMANVSGVSKGKAQRYGKPFVELIKQYVEENDIERPTDFVVKQVANKSKIKVSIIQGIDRKIPLGDIASSCNLKMDELMEELNAIVVSGTKLNIDYFIEENVDEYSREDIYDYFMEAENDDPEAAFVELKEEDITIEEIQLVRIKFLSEMAN